MTRVKAVVYLNVPGGPVKYTPDGPDVEEKHYHLLGSHVFDRPGGGAPSGGEDAAAGSQVAKPDNRAGAAKWREYAESVGIEVPEDADKAAVQALVAEHEAADDADDAEAKAAADADGAAQDGSDDANGAGQ